MSYKNHVLSFNLRVDLEIDGSNRWPNRKTNVFEFLKKNKFDIIGFQEVKSTMYPDLIEHLNGYGFFGHYRTHQDEATPIFYNKEKYHVIEHDTFWLSDTPSIISKFDESNFHRICTYGVFKQKSGTLGFFNTHLDYHSDYVSKKQIEVVLNQIDVIRKKYKNIQIVLCGDFNQNPTSDTINFAASALKRIDTGPYATFHGFNPVKNGLPIDHFFLSDDIDATVAVIFDQPNNAYLSDHYPISLKF